MKNYEREDLCKEKCLDLLKKFERTCKMVKRTFYIKGQKFTAKVTKEDTCYVAICKEIGTADQGGTAIAALKNLKACTASHLIVFPHKNPYNIIMSNGELTTKLKKIAENADKDKDEWDTKTRNDNGTTKKNRN